MRLSVNGEERNVQSRAADTLLQVLRGQLGLTGSKPGCLNGDCGACTVTVDGIAMKSCLMLAVEAEGRKVTTIEGLRGMPIQQAFMENFAFQCGYCTSGFIMNAHALIASRPGASDEEVEEWLASNICRCTGYREIEAAVKSCLHGGVRSQDD